MDASGTAVASLDGAMAAHARVTQHRPATERGGRAPAVEPLFEQLVHDLRNPLGVIGYFAEVIPTAPAAERDELCERVRVNAQRALHVLGEFVLLADLRRGRSHLQPAPCDAIAMVDELVTEIESVERRPGQIHCRIEPIEVDLADRVAALHHGRLTIDRLGGAGVITLALPAAV